MREHMGLYRGKRTDNGEWVEGAYFKHDTVKVCLTTDDPKSEHLIICDGFCDWGFEPAMVGHKVDPDTVGECTGLKDKNGKLIFEGDVLRLDCEADDLWVFNFGNCGGVQNVDHEVGYMGFYLRPLSDRAIRARDFGQRDDPCYYLNAERLSICGNIHDNPELLGGSE